MDKSADPCVNFYQYSCGNWSKLNPIPPDQAGWNVYAKMEDDNQRFLWGILQQAAQGGSARSANEQKIGDYFHACMDEGAVERAGIKPIEPALARIAGLKSVDEMASYVGSEHRQGIDRNTLFGFGSEQDFDNSTQMMAFALVGGLGLPDRTIHKDGCQIARDPPPICTTRRKHAGTAGRVGARCKDGCAGRDGYRNCPGQSVSDANGKAQSIQSEAQGDRAGRSRWRRNSIGTLTSVRWARRSFRS